MAGRKAQRGKIIIATTLPSIPRIPGPGGVIFWLLGFRGNRI
jgi:hypothetical protein